MQGLVRFDIEFFFNNFCVLFLMLYYYHWDYILQRSCNFSPLSCFAFSVTIGQLNSSIFILFLGIND